MDKITDRTYPARNASPLSLVLLMIVSLAVFTITIHTSLNGTNFGADFYTFWVAGKAVVEDGISPYDAEVTRRSQMGIYNRMAEPDEDQMAFAYPLYSLLAILPAVFLSFDWAMSFWLALNIVIFLLVLMLFAHKHNRWVILTTLLLYPIFFGLVMGNFTILVASCILFFYGTVVTQRKHSLGVQILAGMLLAWSTVKPQFAWLLVGFAIMIAIREKWVPLLRAFFLTMFFFFAVSFLIVPGWFSQWLVRIQEYAQYVNGLPVIIQLARPFLNADVANIFGWAVIALLLITLAYLIVRWWQDKMNWIVVMAWTGMTTFLIHPHGLSYEQIVPLLPLIVWAGSGAEERKTTGLERAVFWIAAIVVSWLPMMINSSMHVIAIDRSPILLIVVWVVWLIIRESRAPLPTRASFTAG